jgi:hypothetical protein
MRIVAAAMAILALGGCAVFRRDLPPWARPTAAAASPTGTPASEQPGVPGTTTTTTTAPPPEPPAPSAPSPVVATPPPAAPAPPRPAAPPPAPTPVSPQAPPPATQSLPLTASLPPSEVRRLQDETQRAIEDTERLLRQLDGRPLVPKDLETLRLAQGLVEQARKALGGQEYERAANLAAKARTLADDLSTRR